MPSYRGEIAAGHPQFPEGSAAACREATGPVDLNAPDIAYTAEDDEAIEKFNRDCSKSYIWHRLVVAELKQVSVQTTWHSVCGAKIAIPLHVAPNTCTCSSGLAP